MYRIYERHKREPGDLSNMKFGRLTVLKKDPTKRASDGSFFWICRCDCEDKTIVSVSTTPLKRGTTQSCGCLRKRGPKVDLSGTAFDRLTVLERDIKRITKRGEIYWLCKCSCENNTIKSVRDSDLKSGSIRSCGCLNMERLTKHGMKYTKTYKAWQNMKQRINNPKNSDYHNYGGRGITYDPRWEDFRNFYSDLGEIPPGMELDRIDPDGNYEKSNCRFINESMQTLNQRKIQGVSSKYVGVSRHQNRWRACYHGKQIGSFTHEINAALAYDKFVKNLHGEDAPTNKSRKLYPKSITLIKPKDRN